MSFKNHGPGGCCCGGCPLWQDQFDLNGWNVDDEGQLAWDSHTYSLTNFYEQSGALVATRSGQTNLAGNVNFQGPRLRYGFTDPNAPVMWNLDHGYKAQFTINVDYGHVLLGHCAEGLLFDSLTNKAYPVTSSTLYLGFAQIHGEGFDFDPTYPFDVTLTRCGDIVGNYSNYPSFGTCQINAGPDRTGNTIDYRFLTEPNQGQWTGYKRTIKFDMYKYVDGDPLVQRTPGQSGNRKYYPAVVPSTPQVTPENRPNAQFRLHDITMEAIANLYRYTAFPNNPKLPLSALDFTSTPSVEEVENCELVPEWNIDNWINPYKVGNIEGYPIFGGDAKNGIKVTASGTPSRPIDGEDVFSPLVDQTKYSLSSGYGADVSKDTSVLVPSNMVIQTGRHKQRSVYFTKPNTVFIQDYFIMDSVQETIVIKYWFEIGAAGNREFPFTLTTPFAADATVVAASGTPAIEADDAWTAVGNREWLIEKI